jgi:hypothetical protein
MATTKREGISAVLAAIEKRKAFKHALQQYEVESVRLDRGGYDRSGRYFGVGPKLYRVFDNDTGKSLHVRAPTARKARELAIANPHHWGGWR